MALLKDTFKISATGMLLGVAATLAAPVVLAVVATTARPMLKAAIKGYLNLSGRLKEVVEEAREQISDVVAEARAEHSASGTSRDGRLETAEGSTSPSRV